MIKVAHYQSLEYLRIEALVLKYEKNINRPLHILDFGCGRGKFIDMFLSMRQNVTAVDLNKDYVFAAQKKGISAFFPDDFFAKSKGEFDVILLSHVIEHLNPEQLVELIPRLCGKLAQGGRLILVSPTLGERFYHDFSHVRPYMPQSVRHAFGQIGAPISFGENAFLKLIDIYFFKDPYRTRLWRSFYVGSRFKMGCTSLINNIFDIMWRFTCGRIGVTSSWLGVYQKDKNNLA